MESQFLHYQNMRIYLVTVFGGAKLILISSKLDTDVNKSIEKILKINIPMTYDDYGFSCF